MAGPPIYLIIYPLDGRNIHVVGGGAHIFILLVSEDVNADQVNLQKKILSLQSDVKCLRYLLHESVQRKQKPEVCESSASQVNSHSDTSF